MLRAVLPHMRAKRSAGLTLALRAELEPFGIEVTIIEPGSFRTAILSKGFSPMKNSIPDYLPTTKPLHDHVTSVNAQETKEKQPGDPAKGAQIIIEVLTKTGRCAGKTIPSRMLLGKDAVRVGDAVLQYKQTVVNLTTGQCWHPRQTTFPTMPTCK
ncbi:unnamed protein product [Peronospora belbahrii]|nr:unnamed protein product [Peronospora belbahrii]